MTDGAEPSAALETAAVSLRGKRALVTGAGLRVGQAIALALGAEGMHVAVHYRESRAGADETVAKIRAAGGSAVTLPADLSSRDQARSLVDRALTELGGLDLVVPSPSWPLLFAPQHRREPVERSAHVCACPADTATAPEISLICTGVRRWILVPSPS